MRWLERLDFAGERIRGQVMIREMMVLVDSDADGSEDLGRYSVGRGFLGEC